jgi:hypothetical protein
MAHEAGSASTAAELAQYVVSAAPTGVAALDASDAFASLTEPEALYALALSQAAWGAAPIVLLQTSPESVPIFLLVRLVFDRGVAATRLAALSAGVSETNWALFLKFVATFIDNSGNYMSFGDTKFVPGLPGSEFERIINACVGVSDKVMPCCSGPCGVLVNAVLPALPRLLPCFSGPCGVLVDSCARPTLRPFSSIAAGTQGAGVRAPDFSRLSKVPPCSALAAQHR